MSTDEPARTRTGGITKRARNNSPQRPRVKELVCQEQRLAATYQHAGIGIIEVDAEGQILHLNAQSCALTGYSSDDLLGHSIFDVTGDSKDIEVDNEQFRRQVAGELDRYTIERRIRRKDGRYVWMSITSSSVRDANGRFLYAVRIQHDLTERRRTEEALAARVREQTALYQFTDRLQRAESLDDVYEPALDAILDALQCSRASILLRDSSGVMRFVASRGLSEQYRRAVDGHSPWDANVKDAEPICVEDVARAAFAETLKQVVIQEGIHALAFIPLQPAGRLIGKFMTYYDIPHAFTRPEIDLALTIARQLGFGIERKRAEQALQASKDRLEFALNAAQLGWWQFDPLHRVISGDMRFQEIFDTISDIPIEDFVMKRLHPDDADRFRATFQAALDPADPRPYAIEFRIRQGHGQILWVAAHGLAYFEGGGHERRAASIVGTVANITERKEREEKEHLLMREINHRAKNMLSVVDAIAHQTAIKNPEDFTERFSERIQALSANQDLLIRNEWQGVEIEHLARAQLAHFAGLIGSRITVRGSQLRLRAASSQAIGLALHELATNAGKYGALSTDTGRVEISWGTDCDAFSMSWTEREGPPVSAPSQRGFGTIVMETMVERSVGGTVDLDYAPSGLTWRLTCPADNALEPLARAEIADDGKNRTDGATGEATV
jgi:PAS domain S-box-containing protein